MPNQLVKPVLFAFMSLVLMPLITSNSSDSNIPDPTPSDIFVSTPDCNKKITHLALSPDGSLLATSDDVTASIELWNTDKFSFMKTIPILREEVTDITFSPDNQLLVWASSTNGMGSPQGRGSIEVYDLNTDTIRASLIDVADIVTELNVFDDDTTIAFLGSRYGYLRATVQVWDTTTQTIISKKIAADIAPAFSTDAPIAFLGTKSSDADYYSFQIEQWDGQNDIVLHSVEVPYPILAMTLNQDGSVAASADDFGTISFWNTSTLTTTVDFESGDTSVGYLAFIGDDQLLSVGHEGDQQHIRIWNLDPQPEMLAQKNFTEDMIGRFAVEPEQQLVLANGKDAPFGISLWNYETDALQVVALDC